MVYIMVYVMLKTPVWLEWQVQLACFQQTTQQAIQHCSVGRRIPYSHKIQSFLSASSCMIYNISLQLCDLDEFRELCCSSLVLPHMLPNEAFTGRKHPCIVDIQSRKQPSWEARKIYAIWHVVQNGIMTIPCIGMQYTMLSMLYSMEYGMVYMAMVYRG